MFDFSFLRAALPLRGHRLRCRVPWPFPGAALDCGGPRRLKLAFGSAPRVHACLESDLPRGRYKKTRLKPGKLYYGFTSLRQTNVLSNVGKRTIRPSDVAGGEGSSLFHSCLTVFVRNIYHWLRFSVFECTATPDALPGYRLGRPPSAAGRPLFLRRKNAQGPSSLDFSGVLLLLSFRP